MNEMIVRVLKAIMDNTEIDDKAWDAIANTVKETIPGEQYEPVIGEIMVQIGDRLKVV